MALSFLSEESSFGWVNPEYTSHSIGDLASNIYCGILGYISPELFRATAVLSTDLAIILIVLTATPNILEELH
jgi:hypothetical protein